MAQTQQLCPWSPTLKPTWSSLVADRMPISTALTKWFQALGIEIVAVTPEQGTLAVKALFEYGKGRHPARLNLSDCFAYALAKSRDLPLLFKGDDFSKTDLAPA